MHYPKPKYGHILRGSEEVLDNGFVHSYKGHEILAAQAYYQFDKLFNGLSGATRPCWMVTQNGRRLMVIDGELDDVEREIDKTFKESSKKTSKKPHKKEEYEEESSSSSSEDEEPRERINLQYEERINIPKTKRRIGRQRRT